MFQRLVQVTGIGVKKLAVLGDEARLLLVLSQQAQTRHDHVRVAKCVLDRFVLLLVPLQGVKFANDQLDHAVGTDCLLMGQVQTEVYAGLSDFLFEI